MVKWQLIWRLRSLKATLATSGSMGRVLVPFVEITEFGLSHGLREVVMRSRHRLGWSPSRVGATDIETLSNKETIRVAAEVPVGRTPYERAYFNSVQQAQARAGEDFVPETAERADFSDAQVRVIAFYLPQFHQIPENDAWWGKGFTEWTNVSKAVPQFEGHYQPHLPGELGFYDLRVPEVQRRQVALAQNYGIYGFCFHYYFFNGKRLLERPLEQFVADTTLDFPFCICWANENWTRRWDGLEHEVLMAQVHSEETDIAFIKAIEPLLRDKRYITVAGRPLIVVYRVTLMPDPRATANRWRTYCRQVGLKEPYLVAAQAFGFTDPAKVGFDAAVEFPPHIEPPEIAHSLRLLNPNFRGRAYSYEALSSLMQRQNTNAAYKAFKTVVPGWDNEPRKPGNGIVVTGSTPALYKSWLNSVCKAALEDPTPDARLVFINAWNEWGEGAHLEPDRRYGYAYLEATRQVVKEYRQPGSKVSVIVPIGNQAATIERRLHAIITQDVGLAEIVVVDDASTDGGAAIAEGMLRRSGITFRIVPNETRSGHIFAQVLKGIAHSTGGLIWIVGNDDEPDAGFLKHILPQFAREDVLLACGRAFSVNGRNVYTDFEGSSEGVSDDRWRGSHTRTAHELFTSDSPSRNVISTISCALFRRPTLTDEEIAGLTSDRVSRPSDFYALVSRGGSIAFCKEAKVYLRPSQPGTSSRDLHADQASAERATRVGDVRDLHGGPDHAVAAGAKRPLKICIASYGFGIGGGELAPIVLANALRSGGHHVTFLVMHREVPDPSLRGRLLSDIPVLNWDNCGSRFTNVAKQYGFDVINSHNVAVEHEFFLRGIVPGIPYVATLHGGYETVPGLLTKEFIAYLDRTVDRWLYLADKNVEPLLTHGLQGRFTKVFNAAPAPLSLRQATSGLRSALRAGEDAIVLVLASRAIYAKGWDIAIEATKRVRSHTGCDAHLLLIGDGEDFRTFQTAARDAPYVHLWGPSSNAERLIGECDLGVFPSTYVGESFPLFVLECFAAGLPVIATDVGAIREMMTTEDAGIAGVLIPVSDDRGVLVERFAAAISALVRDKGSIRIAASHAVSRAKHYDIDRLVQIYLDAFTPTPKEAG
jgi:glycosyltransferase involved in cell wall biosynthesis